MPIKVTFLLRFACVPADISFAVPDGVFRRTPHFVSFCDNYPQHLASTRHPPAAPAALMGQHGDQPIHFTPPAYLPGI